MAAKKISATVVRPFNSKDLGEVFHRGDEFTAEAEIVTRLVNKGFLAPTEPEKKPEAPETPEETEEPTESPEEPSEDKTPEETSEEPSDEGVSIEDVRPKRKRTTKKTTSEE